MILFFRIILWPSLSEKAQMQYCMYGFCAHTILSVLTQKSYTYDKLYCCICISYTPDKRSFMQRFSSFLGQCGTVYVIVENPVKHFLRCFHDWPDSRWDCWQSCWTFSQDYSCPAAGTWSKNGMFSYFTILLIIFLSCVLTNTKV